MSARTEYWIERLAPIGLGAFVTGVALVAGGTVWEGLRLAASFGGGASSSTTLWTELLRAVVSLGDPLMYNGVAFYVAGRVMETWKVSIIGLERGPKANLRSKGPDASNTVWIGRTYETIDSAERNAQLLRRRMHGAGQ